MNQVVTDGLVLMPPAFAEGLGVWSRQDGQPGSDTWATAANAALVPADPDFGTCLELIKTDATTKIRHMAQTPIIPGLYLRVTVRVKVLSGNLPTIRIAGWAGTASDQNVAGVDQTGPETTVPGYGDIVTISAILGTGARTGVDMAWGAQAAYGYLGLDLTGPNGGQVRIESLTVEDVTSIFHRKMMDWVDVRDFGALGDGTTDDRDAFVAADAAAAGREIMVPAGVYRIGSTLAVNSPVRFEGRVSMPDGARLSLNRNFDLKGYTEAFGDDQIGLRKGLQALFNQSDHEGFDLNGRRVVLDAPIDVQAVVGNKNTYAIRRMVRNGQLSADASPAWDDDVTTRSGTWTASNPRELSNVSNVADIPIGALVSAPTGVGREIYVVAKNEAQGKLTLSTPFWGAPISQTYTFRRFKYILDFSGFQNLQRFILSDIEFICAGRCSGLMIPLDGLVFQIQDCFFTGPKDRGITSPGEGCQGMQIDRCQFLSNEQQLDATQRTTIAFNTHCSDVKVRDNRAVKFRHFGIVGGPGNIISGNHFFQGDNVTNGPRTAGIVFATQNAKTTFDGNYVDNCFVEWGNEYDANPDFSSEFSFHGMTINGNIFFASGAAPWMNFIVIKPYGDGHYINGMSVCDNLFKETNGPPIDAVDGVDTTHAGLDNDRTRDLLWTGNTYQGVVKQTANPVVVKHQQNTAGSVWTLDLSDRLPFGTAALAVTAVVPEGPVTTLFGTTVFSGPYARPRQGADQQSVELMWDGSVMGTIHVTVKGDQ